MATRIERFRRTLSLWVTGWLRIPLLGSLRPRIEVLDAERCVIRIPHRRWTRNHLGSMYFGALAMGADCAGGLLAVEEIRRSGASVSFVFKSFQADFLRRPESDVLFLCEEGPRVRALVARALASPERQGDVLEIQAAVRTPQGALEPVARFRLELSLKRRAGKSPW